MSVWGSEAAISVLLFAVTFPIALWFLVYHHYHRHGSFRGWSALVTVVSFFYFAGLVAFTLFPLPDTSTSYCVAREGLSYWQLSPFASFGDVLAAAGKVGFIGVLRTGVFLQVFFNVVLLFPLGALLAYRYRKSFGSAVLIGFGVSLFIEATQGTGVWGLFACPYRLADVDDLITNTAGVAIGWVVGRALSRYLPDPDIDSTPDLDPPRVIRRLFAVVIDVVVFVVVGLVIQAVMIAAAMHWNDGVVPTWIPTANAIVGTVIIGVVLFLVVPLVEPRRATLGQMAVWLGEVDAVDLRRASAHQITIRFAVRWLPMLAAAFIQPLPIIGIVGAYEMVTVLVRSDRRSLSSVAAGTTTVTRRSMEAGSDRMAEVEDDGKPSTGVPSA